MRMNLNLLLCSNIIQRYRRQIFRTIRGKAHWLDNRYMYLLWVHFIHGIIIKIRELQLN